MVSTMNKNLSKVAFVFSTLSLLTTQTTYTNSLSDCEAFASLFANTCTSTSSTVDLTDVASEDFTCTGATGYCAGTGDDTTTCTWSRQLCVTCSQTSSVTYIRVQSNGLPNHCYQAMDLAPVAQDIDFTVKWQWDVGDNVYQDPENQKQVDNLVCSTSHTSAQSIPMTASFTAAGTADLTTTVAIAISGVAMFSGVSLDLVDPVYPAAYGSVTTAELDSVKETLDACLSHSQAAGFYHYHVMAPCAIDTTFVSTPTMCEDVTDCLDEPVVYAEGAYASNQVLTPIGIAKDGHIIYGPYKDDGTIVADCDVDVCNGGWINGIYGYYATPFHPYFIACFGPGTNTTVSQECSTNPRICTDASTYLSFLTFFVGTISMVALFF